MAVTRTKNKIQFVQEILSVFTGFRHSGRAYLEYLRQSKGGDEFDVRDMTIKPLFRKLGYDETDFYNEVTIQAGEVDLNIGSEPLQPVITVETKSTAIHDLKSARVDQLFPYIKELHTPIGIVTNGRLFEVWEQKVGMHLLVNIDFVPIVAEYLKKDISGITDDDFSNIIKLMYLKKEIRYISDEDLYAVPEIDIVEATAFQNLLDDLAKLVEITRVDVEEQFNLYLEDYKIFEQNQDKLEDWRLDRLQRDHKKSIQTIRYFHRWAELNNIDLEKNQNGQEKFVTETMYILINRILLIRIAEDKGIIPRQISNGAIKDFKHFIGGVKVDYNRLLKIAYDTMLGVYEHFFKHDIFDWYIPDSELLLRLLLFNKYNFSHVNRDILGNLYQKYIDKEERKRLGQFYTPDEVVQYILDGIGYTSDAGIENKTLLDPACGSGGFLVPAANRLITRLKEKNFDPVTILIKVRDNIYGFDINPFAAHLTETNLLFQVVDLISEAKKLDPNFRMEQFNVFVTDSLRIPEEGQKGKNMSLFEHDLLDSAAVYDAEIVKDIKLKRCRFNEGVDFIVGNPPYGAIVSPKNNLKETFYIAKKEYDSYTLFVEMGLKYASVDSKVGYIIPSVSLTNDKNVNFRFFILNTSKILNVTTLPYDVFPDVYVDTMIIILEKYVSVLSAKCEPGEIENFVSVNSLSVKQSPKDLLSKKWTRSLKINQLKWLDNNKYIFDVYYSTVRESILNKMKKDVRALSDFAEVKRGLQAYGRAKGHTKEQISKRIYHSDQKKGEDYLPELSGENIKRYLIDFRNDKWIKYGTHLAEYTPMRFFEGPRLLVRLMISRQFRIMATFTDKTYANSKHIYNVKFFSDEINMKYVLALINSRLYSYYQVKGSSIALKDDFPQMTMQEIRDLPIKMAAKSKQKMFQKLVDNILEIIKKIQIVDEILEDFQCMLTKFKSEFHEYSELQLIPLHDLAGLQHIQLEKRLGKPNIQRDAKRVYLTKSYYLDLDTEVPAKYIELALKSMQDNLRGLTKPDILRLVKVPKDDKVLRAILKYNSDLKKQKIELERQRNAIDREIDERVYELYGITKEERRIIEGK